MKKGILFFLTFLLITFFSNAQDDYVINEPAELKNDTFKTLPNPDFTSYLLSSSAYTLKSRDMRFSGTDLIYAKGSYGLTNNTMASVSISLVGTLIGSIKQQIDLNDNLKMGISLSIGQLLSVPEDSSVFFGGGQTMITFGDIQNNVTLGSGIYYAKATFDLINEKREFFLSNTYIATQKQIGRRVYVIAEGIYFWNYNIISGAVGIKIIIKKNMALGFGIMPLLFIDPRFNGTYDAAENVIPVITFRLTLDRH